MFWLKELQYSNTDEFYKLLENEIGNETGNVLLVVDKDFNLSKLYLNLNVDICNDFKNLPEGRLESYSVVYIHLPHSILRCVLETLDEMCNRLVYTVNTNE